MLNESHIVLVIEKILDVSSPFLIVGFVQVIKHSDILLAT
jgi:hypothetical protein